jgi:phosphoribosylanthranilate isomerase
MPVDVKICGLSTPETLDAALGGGAAYVGLMFYPPSPRAVSFDAARGLAARVPARVKKVGVFVEPCNALLDEAIAAGALDIVQLHNTPANRAAAIAAHTRREIWATVAVKTRAELLASAAYKGAAARILYDARTDAALPGGMGLRFDWTLLAGFDHPLPWALAGGLDAANLGDAVGVTGARIVDVSSGVETAPGVKDVDKIAAFLKAAREL